MCRPPPWAGGVQVAACVRVASLRARHLPGGKAKFFSWLCTRSPRDSASQRFIRPLRRIVFTVRFRPRSKLRSPHEPQRANGASEQQQAGSPGSAPVSRRCPQTLCSRHTLRRVQERRPGPLNDAEAQTAAKAARPPSPSRVSGWTGGAFVSKTWGTKAPSSPSKCCKARGAQGIARSGKQSIAPRLLAARPHSSS